MAKSSQKRRNVQRRLADKRARQASRARSNHFTSDGPLHSLPLAACQINTNWREVGLATVFIARRQSQGQIRAASFLVDVWGVGVKDCFLVPYRYLSEAVAWLKRSEEKLQMTFEECPEELGAQLIWGGVWYGKQAGFFPPREFHQCKRLVPRVCEEDLDLSLFGKEGKRLIIGDLRDLKRRSHGNYSPDKTDGHFILGGLVEEDDTSPWQELLVEDEGMPEGKERVFVIRGEYILQDFARVFDALSGWDDLDIVEAEIAERYAAFNWTRTYPANHWNPMSRLPGARQHLGCLVLEGTCLSVEVKGKSWMLIMDDRLHRAFGGAISRGDLRIQDPLELIEQRGSGERAPSTR